jgi:aminoglycoside 6'-N-acetyltransferase I
MSEPRRLGPADRQAWLAKRHALWPHHTEDSLAPELDEILADPERRAGFGTLDGTSLIAFAEASGRPWGDGCRTRPVAWLEGIYVDEGRRHQGLALRLVDAVTAWAKSRNLVELGSDVHFDNAASLAAHAHWGFAEIKRQVVLRKDI